MQSHVSPVTVAEDKAHGEFRCELIDSKTVTWKRAILVQVIGKLESVADYKKDTLCSTLWYTHVILVCDHPFFICGKEQLDRFQWVKDTYTKQQSLHRLLVVMVWP